MGWYGRKSQWDSRYSDDHNADQDRAADPPRHQYRDQDQSESGEPNLRIGRFSQADESSRAGHDDFCIAKTHESNKESNPRGGPVLQAIGNVVHEVLTDVGKGQ